MSTLLKYNISKWAQLTQCLSNNSRDLHITVSSFVGDTVSGQLIAVNHSCYGTLFACMTNGSGNIISTHDESGSALSWLTKDEILLQLQKFGFVVTFHSENYLSGKQLSYLMTLQGLQYDHIAPINLVSYDESGSQHLENTIVAFDGNVHPEWLPSGTIVSQASFIDALSDGTCVNVTAMSEKYNFTWDWLTYVANISDILADNSGQSPYEVSDNA